MFAQPMSDTPQNMPAESWPLFKLASKGVQWWVAFVARRLILRPVACASSHAPAAREMSTNL